MHCVISCRCCRTQLEPARILAYLVESDTRDNPTMLEAIRILPHLGGKPIPMCQSCQGKLANLPASSPRKRAGQVDPRVLLLGGLAFLVGVFFTAPRT